MTARANMAFDLQFGLVRLLLCRRLAVVGIFGEDCPVDPGRLVRHSNRCKTDGFALEKLHDPRMHTFRVSTGTLNLGCHANHEQSSKISVSLLADAAKALFTTARLVQRRKSQPGGKLASVPELFAVADGGDNGRRGDGTDAGN